MHRRTFIATTGATVSILAGCAESHSGRASDTEHQAYDEHPPTIGDSSEEETIEASSDDQTDENDDEVDDETSDDVEGEERAAMGDRLDGDDLQFAVLDWRRTSSYDGLVGNGDGVGIGDDHRTPADGHVFQIVEMAAKNTSETEFRSIDELAPVLIDPDGERHEHRESVSTPILESGQLAPGEVERVELVYELPDATAATTVDLAGGSGDRVALDRTVVNLDERASSAVSLEQDLRIPLHEFGESVEQDDVTVSVDELRLGNNLGAFMQPEAGYEYIVVGIEVSNESGAPIELSKLDQFHLKDEAGRNYPEDTDVLLSFDSFDDSDPLEAEESRTGQLAYHVEQGIEELYWIADFSQWGAGDRTIWQLR